MLVWVLDESIVRALKLSQLTILEDENQTFSFFFFAAGLQDLSSPTRDGTQTPCSGSSETQPLDRQGSPLTRVLTKQSKPVSCQCVEVRFSPSARISFLAESVFSI